MYFNMYEQSNRITMRMYVHPTKIVYFWAKYIITPVEFHKSVPSNTYYN